MEVKRVVAYARFSSDNQRTESIDAQVRAIRDYCLKNNYKLTHIYKDEGISGRSTENREEFLQMIKDSKNKKFDCVVVHKFDRFARNRYDHIINEKKLNDNGVLLLSVLENITDSPESIILKSVLTGMNEYYSINLAREVRKGQKENALKCVHNGGIAPLGYDIDKEKKYVINEKESLIVKSIFKMYLEGYGYRTICEKLNEKGYKNKRGSSFKMLSIRDTLLNEKYTGVFIFGKKDKHGKLTENEIRIENGIPAIIDKITFSQVLNKMRNNKNHSRNNAEEKYLLTGLCYCGECGGIYSGGYKTVNRNGSIDRGYLCRNRKDKVNDCKNHSIRKDVLESLVIKVLKENVFSIEQIEIISSKVYSYLEKNYSENKSNIKNIKKIIQSLEEKKKKILDYNLDGVLSDEEFITKKQDIEDKILNCKEEILNLKLNEKYLNKDKIKNYLLKLGSKLDKNINDDEIIQNIIFNFIQKIIIFKEYIQINLNLFPIIKPAISGGDEPIPKLAVKLKFYTNNYFYKSFKRT